MHFKTTALFKAVCNLKEQAARQKNLLLAMKLTAIILLTACIGVSARTTAQTVSFSGKDVTLQTVFDAVTKQTGYTVFCNYDLLRNAKKVTLNLRNATLSQVMQEALKNQPLTYTIIEKTIVVKAKPSTVDLQSTDNPPIVSTPPPIDIRGRIVNEAGDPLEGISVKIKGTNTGTSTNANGEFILNNVDEDAVLVFTGINIEAFETRVAGRKEFALNAKTKVESLNEVVINKGYYTEKQKYSVGNVASVTAKEIERQPVNNPLLALQGRVPGLVVTQASGISGGGVNISVQGQNSILRGNDPLIVVDGVPFPSQLLSTGVASPLGGFGSAGGSGSPLSFINPSDIERIDVLKDADATAIYGSRGANGVILITTKKGKTGKPKVEVNAQHGIGQVANKLKMLNTRQYLDMRYEAYQNDNINWRLSSVAANDLKVWDTTRYTDWQETLIGGTAQYSNINTALSGGNANVSYLVGATYNRQTMVFPGDFKNNTASIHFNLISHSINKNFRFQLSSNYLVGNNRLPGVDLTSQAVLFEPNAPSLYNMNGTLNWEPDVTGNSTWDNPLSYTIRHYKNKTNNIVSNAVIGYKLLQQLELSCSFGYSKMLTDDYTSRPMEALAPEFRPTSERTASYGMRNVESWIVEPQLNYADSFLRGRVELLIGTTLLRNLTNGHSVNGTGYSSDALLHDIRSAPKLTVNNSFDLEYKYHAVFSRLNYNLNDRYIINLTARRDGSTRFGAKNRFNSFGAAGLAWIFSNEKFMEGAISVLKFGKLRFSYGSTGNDQIDDYSFMSLFTPTTGGEVIVPYQGTGGLEPENLNNPYLQWEETRKLNIGIDLGFFNDRINISGNFARNRSSNQLLSYELPSITGFTSITQNFPATVQNISWEFMLNSINIRSKHLIWQSGINLTIPRNKLLDFSDLQSSSYANTLIVGKPLSFRRLYHYLNVDPLNGNYVVADVRGNPTTSSIPIKDRPILISGFPEFYGGINNNLSYKSFSLDFLFQFTKQKIADIYYWNGGTVIPGRFLVGLSNQPVTVLNRWQKPGDNAEIRKFTTAPSTANNALVGNSDKNFSTGSYIRLKNISLVWALPTGSLKNNPIQNCSLYIQAQNLFTITNYRGLDPETGNLFSLPPLRVITLGVKFGL